MNIYTTQDERQLSADYGKYLTQAIDGLEDRQRVLCKIVHLPLSESTGDWQEIGEDRATEIRAAKAAAAGSIAELAQKVTQLSQQATAAATAAEQAQQTADEAKQAGQQNASQALLTTMLINTYQLTDEQALAVKDLYPKWTDIIGQQLAEGYKLTDGGVLYKVIQQHTAQEDWNPSATPSLYAVVSAAATEEHAGTKEDPIPYVQMMLIEQGKYYTQDGQLYIGLMDAKNGYPNDLKDLHTLAQPVNE